jgi:hypothetical protein
MKAGYLSEYFNGVGAKRLTPVEVDPVVSNQHEFQGVHRLKTILGETGYKTRFNATYIRLSDETDLESVESFATWSDVRKQNPDRSAEYHMYYSATATPLVHTCKPGDILIVALRPDNSLAIFLVEDQSTYKEQLLWLFGLSDDLRSLNVREIENGSNRELHFAARYILDELGIDIEIADEDWLDIILEKIGEKFPSTSKFSEFSRTSIKEEISLDNPDSALMTWMEHEEMLFRTLERHIVSKRLEEGFNDVDDFIQYSLSVQNRRKSRAGFALENHLEFIFESLELEYSRGEMTENRAKPDFLFPGIQYYKNPAFLAPNLTMLGVKSTCKDRWRQVLSEAKRIDEKHLFTTEPAISQNQTNEMKSNNLKLVLPENVHDTYNPGQRKWLMSLKEFIDVVKIRQQNI